eukprot:Clim_evm16s33 gene=Clim_evmTU16s33
MTSSPRIITAAVSLQNISSDTDGSIEAKTDIMRSESYVRQARMANIRKRPVYETGNPVLFVVRILLIVTLGLWEVIKGIARRIRNGPGDVPPMWRKVGILRQIELNMSRPSAGSPYIAAADFNRIAEPAAQALFGRPYSPLFPGRDPKTFTASGSVPAKLIPPVEGDDEYAPGRNLIDHRYANRSDDIESSVGSGSGQNSHNGHKLHATTAVTEQSKVHRPDNPSTDPVYYEGLWIGYNAPNPAVHPLSSQSSVLYFLHGGCYSQFSSKVFLQQLLDVQAAYGRMHADGNDPSAFLHIFSLDYGLCPHQCQWPQPRREAVAGYLYLTQTVGIDPKRIVIAGDSAGGSLAIATVRYLRDFFPAEMQPAALVLISPVVVLEARLTEAVDKDPSIGGDALDAAGLWHMREAVYGPLGRDHPAFDSSNRDPYLSPALAEDGNRYFPPQLVMYGTGEILRDQIELYIERCRRVGKAAHRNLHVVVAEDMPHDFPLLPRAGDYYKEIIAAYIAAHGVAVPERAFESLSLQ